MGNFLLNFYYPSMSCVSCLSICLLLFLFAEAQINVRDRRPAACRGCPRVMAGSFPGAQRERAEESVRLGR